jgi:predicted transcriptional regulator
MTSVPPTPSRVISINPRLRYEISMTELLERAVQSLRSLPPETQDALARILQQLVGDDPSIVTLSADEEASLQTSLAQAERGEFATEEQIKAVWAKHGL